MISINLNLVWTIINLIVLYLLLKHFLIGPVTNIMDRRRQMIEDGFKNAQAAQDDANRLKQEYETALSGAKQESVQLVEDARKSARAEYDRIVNEAGEKAALLHQKQREIQDGDLRHEGENARDAAPNTVVHEPLRPDRRARVLFPMLRHGQKYSPQVCGIARLSPVPEALSALLPQV